MYNRREEKISVREMDKDYMLLVDTAVLAGEIMLESGAETYRVEDTIGHFLGTAGLPHAEAYVTTTGIMATLSAPDIEAITVVRRVKRRTTNMNRIYRVNDVSRKFSGGKIELSQAFCELKHIKEVNQYSRLIKRLGIVMTAAFFCMLLGGDACETLIAAGSGAFLSALMWAGERIGLQGFLLDGLNTLLVVFVTMFVCHLTRAPVREDMIIIGCIMPMVPGVAITNAIRDTLQGDYVSGAARILEACMEAAAIAYGACIGILLFGYLT